MAQGWSIIDKTPSTAQSASINSSTGVANFPANPSTTTDNVYTIQYDNGNGCTETTTYTVKKCVPSCTLTVNPSTSIQCESSSSLVGVGTFYPNGTCTGSLTATFKSGVDFLYDFSFSIPVINAKVRQGSSTSTQSGIYTITMDGYSTDVEFVQQKCAGDVCSVSLAASSPRCRHIEVVTVGITANCNKFIDYKLSYLGSGTPYSHSGTARVTPGSTTDITVEDYETPIAGLWKLEWNYQDDTSISGSSELNVPACTEPTGQTVNVNIHVWTTYNGGQGSYMNIAISADTPVASNIIACANLSNYCGTGHEKDISCELYAGSTITSYSQWDSDWCSANPPSFQLSNDTACSQLPAYDDKYRYFYRWIKSSI